MKTKKQKVRFDFYMPCILDEEDQLLFANIEDLLFDIQKLDIESRTGRYFDTPVRMDLVHNIQESPELIYFHLVRMRDEGLASTKRETEDLTDIVLDEDDFIAEDVSGLFDTETCAIMLQRNSHSLSITGLKSYLNQMYDKIHPNDDFEVFFQPVPDRDIIKKAQKIKKFRSMELRFASSKATSFDNAFGGFLGGFTDVFKHSGGSNMGLTISATRFEPDLNKTQMLDVIDEIQDNKSLLSTAIFKGSEADAPVEVYDLLNGRLVTYTTFAIYQKVNDTEETYKKYHLKPVAVEEEMYRIYKVIGDYQSKVKKNLKWN